MAWKTVSKTSLGNVGDYKFPTGFDISNAPREASPALASAPTGIAGALNASPYGSSYAGKQIAERGYFDFGPSGNPYGSSGGGGGGSGGGGYSGPSMYEIMLRQKQERQIGEAAKAGGSALSRLVGSYNRAYQQARSANEQRYQQLLNIASQTTGQREADIRADYTRQGSDIRQMLSRLGLSNTTIAPTMQLGVEREQQSALNRLADQMQQTKLGIIERKQDLYPEASVISSLASMLSGLGPQAVSGISGALGGLRF